MSMIGSCECPPRTTCCHAREGGHAVITAIAVITGSSACADDDRRVLDPRILDSPHVEHRLLPGAVAFERAVLADGVGTLENPVLPRGQPREDFRFHGLRPG